MIAPVSGTPLGVRVIAVESAGAAGAAAATEAVSAVANPTADNDLRMTPPVPRRLTISLTMCRLPVSMSLPS
ncbi:hypothetical protein Airi02_042420 [Actinoallomurus iriomotensis]|uniref:Uncharacterized protein n=1 Tax=Actinoallomurus iriomotensis TaxID=478107 RepID=A0A9W6S331_9ACTN|nr:hypothetical protein Airi02_042420 [Actinoallomurus iriomotensis]